MIRVSSSFNLKALKDSINLLQVILGKLDIGSFGVLLDSLGVG
jgi:hypothetical protein